MGKMRKYILKITREFSGIMGFICILMAFFFLDIETVVRFLKDFFPNITVGEVNEIRKVLGFALIFLLAGVMIGLQLSISSITKSMKERLGLNSHKESDKRDF